MNDKLKWMLYLFSKCKSVEVLNDNYIVSDECRMMFFGCLVL